MRRERLDAIILTEKNTLVEGWVVIEEDCVKVKVDRERYPHLEDLGSSYIADVSIEHDYKDRYDVEGAEIFSTILEN